MKAKTPKRIRLTSEKMVETKFSTEREANDYAKQFIDPTTLLPVYGYIRVLTTYRREQGPESTPTYTVTTWRK